MNTFRSAQLLSIITFIFSVSLSFAKVEVVIGKPLVQNPNLPGFMPLTNNSEIVISRDQYVISWNKKTRSPNWAAWELDPSEIGQSGRSDAFLQDPDLERYLQQNDPKFHAVDPEEYRGSCFDRGHQVPSADRTDKASNNQQTFLMSNMLPQLPYLNRVIWEHFERYCRDLVLNHGKKLYIITGPIYDENLGSIGPKKDIPIPSKNFKIILILNANQTFKDINNRTPTVSVIMPNISEDGSKPIQDFKNQCPPFHDPYPNSDYNDWKKYQTTITEIERETGLRIFQ